MIGTVLSAPINKALGNNGNYGFALVSVSFAIGYIIFFVEETKRPQVEPDKDENDNKKVDEERDSTTENNNEVKADLCKPETEGMEDEPNWARKVLTTFVVRPVKELLQTVFKRRENNLRMLLGVQISVYIMYWFVLQYNSLLYLYMLKAREIFSI